MKKKKRILMNMGSSFDLVPLSDFSAIQCNMESMWQIIAPTVDENINKLSMWELFTTCYVQGLENGMAAALARKDQP